MWFIYGSGEERKKMKWEKNIRKKRMCKNLQKEKNYI